MTPLLVLGGSVPSRELLAMLVDLHSPIVAADAGALQLERHMLVPDIIIGDLDSTANNVDRLRDRGVEILALPNQDANDLDKSLAWIAAHGHGGVTAIGAGGGMFDHAINNLSVLARWGQRLAIRIVDDESIAYLIRADLALDVEVGERLSLIPLPSALLTTEGLEWDLHDEELSIGTREGASNRSSSTIVSIRVRTGCVLVFHYPSLGALDELARQMGKKQ